MKTKCTLVSLFNKDRGILEKELEGFELPKDNDLIQRIISEYFNKLLENDNNFRQSLTESEDYVLQAALSLLSTEQEFVGEVCKGGNEQPTNELSGDDDNVQRNKYPQVLFGTTIGGALGMITCGWGALIGAVAGTAVALYGGIVTQKSKYKQDKQSTINTKELLNIIEKRCESVDNLIETVRVQIMRIKNIYEQREQPSLLNTYSSFVEQVANIISISKNCNENIPPRLNKAILFMEEILESYNLKYENGKIINI